MTPYEKKMLARLYNGSNNYDHADGPIVESQPSGAPVGTLTQMVGNPPFKAQFDISFLTYYFSVAAGTYTQRTAAYILANAAALATQLAGFIFGNSDFASGYARIMQNFVLAGGWAYERPFVYNKDYAATSLGALTAAATALLRNGDVVIPATASNGGVTYAALVVIRCNQVAYATLVDAVNSDKFDVNNIRYILADTSAAGLTQYNNNVFIMNQTLFGKFESDNLSPLSFKKPEQFQAGIIDVPIVDRIDKAKSFGTFINYDSINIQWSVFVKSVNKN